MSKLYNVLSNLCKQKGITGYRMCKDVDIQPSIMTDLKMGRRSGLKADTAARIANYFGVSVDYLLGNEDVKKSPAPDGAGLEDEFIAFYGEVKKDLSEDDIADVKLFLQMKAAKKKELEEFKKKEK